MFLLFSFRLTHDVLCNNNRKTAAAAAADEILVYGNSRSLTTSV